MIGAIFFWERLRQNSYSQTALIGIKAAVVGLLLAAFYHLIWFSNIHSPFDVLWAAMAFIALTWMRCPPWLVVVLGGVLGGVLL